MKITWQLAATVLTVAGIVPLLTAALTKANASGWVKTFLSGLLAALGAVLAYLVDIEGVVNWTQVLLVAASAWGLAGGLRSSTIVGNVEQKINEATGDVGIGTPKVA